MMSKPTSLGQRLRVARLKAGYNTARSLADELGVTANTYYRYERDESIPAHKTLIRLASLLHVTLSHLLNESTATEIPEPKKPAEYINPGFSEPQPLTIAPIDEQNVSEHALCSVLAWRLATNLADIMHRIKPLSEDSRLRVAAELFLELKTAPASAIARIKKVLEFDQTPWALISEYLDVYHSLLEKVIRDE